MNFLVRFRKAQGHEREDSKQESDQGTFQHSSLSGRKFVACGWSIGPAAKGVKSAYRICLLPLQFEM
jgi:hypothetical protein